MELLPGQGVFENTHSRWDSDAVEAVPESWVKMEMGKQAGETQTGVVVGVEVGQTLKGSNAIDK